MSKDINTVIHTLVDVTANEDAAEIDTIGSRDHISADADFYLSVTALVGTAPTADFSIIGTINGVEHILGAFTQASAGVTVEKITILNCPSRVLSRLVVGGTVTDLDATVTCVRF